MESILKMLILASMCVTAFASIEFSAFNDLNKTCFRTWHFLEMSLNISKISRADFMHFNQLEICNHVSASCCTQSIEKSLMTQAMKSFEENFLRRNVLPIKTEFINHVSNFDSIIINILEKSRIEFNSMFNETWSRNNKFFFVFNLFYDNINDYYGEYQINLRDLFKKFFVELTMVFYDDFNNQKHVHLDEKCLESNLDSFDIYDFNILHFVINRLAACLESVKLFNSGLTLTRDLFIEFYAKYEMPSDDCVHMLTKMSSCSTCLPNRFLDSAKPCLDSCLSSYKKCMNLDSVQFNLLWNSYIDLMRNLSSNIEYMLNFEKTLSQFQFQMHETVRIFHENSNQFVLNLKKKCGTSNVIVAKRGKARGKKSIESIPMLNQNEPTLSSFFSELNKYFFNLTDFWNTLIPNTCRVVSANFNQDFCWNGANLTKNPIKSLKKLLDLKLNYMQSNEHSSKSFLKQFEILKEMNKKLYMQINKNYLNVNYSESDTNTSSVDKKASKKSKSEEKKSENEYDYDVEVYDEEYVEEYAIHKEDIEKDETLPIQFKSKIMFDQSAKNRAEARLSDYYNENGKEDNTYDDYYYYSETDNNHEQDNVPDILNTTPKASKINEVKQVTGKSKYMPAYKLGSTAKDNKIETYSGIERLRSIFMFYFPEVSSSASQSTYSSFIYVLFYFYFFNFNY